MGHFTSRTVKGQPLRTKIVCTIGPASAKPETIRSMIEAGMSVARLNMSHADHETHAATFQMIRDCADEMGRHVAIMADLSGPKIRLNQVTAPFELQTGDTIRITRGDADGTQEVLTTSYEHLIDDVKIGEPIFINDGIIRLAVTGHEADIVTCMVERGGWVSSRKGINLPGSKISAPSLTEKDAHDLEFMVSKGVDYVALSFVRTGDAVRHLRKRLKEQNSKALIVSKIEKPDALDHLEDIIEASDVVMVARGDLGIELPVERVPLLQKRIVRACRQALTPVIVATQVLESMTDSPTPTRAEVSDIANAIEDGCDALMLSGETAAGSYPIESVRVMARVARDIERGIADPINTETFMNSIGGDPLRKAMVMGATMIADPLHAKFIVVRSESGVTATYLSKIRGRTPVLVTHPDPSVLRRHALLFGVLAVQSGAMAKNPSMNEELKQLARVALDEELVTPSDQILVISRFPWGEQQPPNNIRAVKVGDVIGE